MNYPLVIQTPLCSDCGFPLVDFGEGWECHICRYAGSEPSPKYENWCWYCNTKIDSRFCVQSKLPGMGYNCRKCQKDLSEYKI